MIGCLLAALIGPPVPGSGAGSGKLSSRSAAFSDEGRSLPRDLGRGIGLVIDDALSVATSPARLDRRGALRLTGILVVGGVLFAFDEELDDGVQRNEGAEPLASLQQIGEAIEPIGLMGDTWPWFAGGLALGYAVDQPWLVRVGGEVLLAQYSSGALRNLAKLIVGRRRPNEGKGAYFFEFDGGTSMPSGHAASAFAAVEVLAHHVDRRWATVLLYSAAVSVGYQRLTSRSHWASDVWIGALSGVGAARLITGRHDQLVRGLASTGAGLVPTRSPGGEPGLAWRFVF